MITNSSPLVLGSKSPRREEILRYYRIPFETAASFYDESLLDKSLSPEEFVEAAAIGKSIPLKEQYKERLLLTADTIIAYQGEIFGKPADKEEAKKVLQTLSGNRHEVLTALALTSSQNVHVGISKTFVTFFPLSEAKIDAYIASVPVLDKAGSYAIQEKGGILVEKIEGCFFNVMGLPVHLLEELLQKEEMSLWNYL